MALIMMNTITGIIVKGGEHSSFWIDEKNVIFINTVHEIRSFFHMIFI